MVKLGTVLLPPLYFTVFVELNLCPSFVQYRSVKEFNGVTGHCRVTVVLLEAVIFGVVVFMLGTAVDVKKD